MQRILEKLKKRTFFLQISESLWDMLIHMPVNRVWSIQHFPEKSSQKCLVPLSALFLRENWNYRSVTNVKKVDQMFLLSLKGGLSNDFLIDTPRLWMRLSWKRDINDCFWEIWGHRYGSEIFNHRSRNYFQLALMPIKEINHLYTHAYHGYNASISFAACLEYFLFSYHQTWTLCLLV